MLALKLLYTFLTFFAIGFFGFFTFEMVTRGHSFFEMGLLGGITTLLTYICSCFLPFWIMPIIGGIIVTLVELIFGLKYNTDFKYWDYSRKKFNFKGQICLEWSLIWIFLSIFVTILTFGFNMLFF